MRFKNSKYAVLAVDDLPENLILIVEGLRTIGIKQKVYTAPNGKIGFELADKYLPDLIITDWEMPEMNGIELTRKLKSTARTQNIPVIMTTAVRLESSELASAFKVGVHDFIRKPFDMLEFGARIQNTLDLAETTSELRFTNQKLDELNTAKSRFFANISHDLKTPISLILGQTDLLLEAHQEYLPEVTLTKLRKIRKFGMKLNQLSNEIRELIRLEERQMTLKMKIFPVDKIVSDVVELFKPLVADEMEIDLKLNIESTENFVYLDPPQFEKVLYNLLTNAIEYTPRGGVVEVILTQKNDTITISVIDQGPGIPKDIISQIFDRFYQVANASNKREGMGIGLSIAKEIIVLHHGKIEVESQDIGAKFIISLPKTNQKPDNTEYTYEINRELKLKINESFPDIPIIEMPSESKKANILVIDDNPDVREIIKEVLSSAYRIIEAKNGLDALQKMELYKIDLIITDLLMPVLDGLEFLSKIKEKSNFSSIPCLIISCRFGTEDQKKALQYGVTNFISKDFDQDELRLRVQALLKESKPENLPQAFEKYNLESATKVLINKLEVLVNDNIDNARFGVHDLATEMAVSERKLYRIFNETLNITPLEFIKKIRFTHIKNMLESGRILNISEASKAIGMSNVSVFKSQFERHFGYPPKVIGKSDM